MTVGKIVAFILLVSAIAPGCMTAVYLAAKPSGAVLTEMRRWCARDAGLHWYGPSPSTVGEFFAPGILPAPPSSKDSFSGVAPWTSYVAGRLEGWLVEGRITALLVNIEPGSSAPHLFGPSWGQPAGVYRFEQRSPIDPACEPWRAAALARGDARPVCIVSTYVGPYDGRVPRSYYVAYEDPAAKRRGFRRHGEDLVVDGKLVARRIAYSALKPGVSSEYSGTWGVKECEPKGPWSVLEAPGLIGPAEPEG